MSMSELLNRVDKGVVVKIFLWFTVVSVLTFLSTFALVRYLDSRHFQTDVETAHVMTQAIQENLVLPNEYMSANDIRKFILSHSNENRSFTPKTANAGFFYVVSQNRVMFAKYDEMPGLAPNLVVDHGSNALASEQGFPTISSPEELYGEGIILLSEDGALVADTITAIRQMPYSADLMESYDSIHKDLNKFLKHFINRDSSQVKRLESLLEEYYPEKTLFVNNMYWSTAATRGDGIMNILFSADISNLPRYNLSLQTDFQEITLPTSIRTIEKDALTASFSSDLQRIIVTSKTTIRILDGAIDEEAMIMHGSFASITIDQLTDYTNDVDFGVDSTGAFKIDFSGLPIKSEVSGYRIVRLGAKYILYIFTDEGLIGYAEGILP